MSTSQVGYVNLSTTLKIFVKEVTGIPFNPTASMIYGGSQKLTARITGTTLGQDSNVTFTISDDSIVSLTETTITTITGIGSAIVTARSAFDSNVNRAVSVTTAKKDIKNVVLSTVVLVAITT